jgi:predicted acyl esterase
LQPDHWNLARIELFPFAHAFRAGSKIRIVIDTPGGTRALWKFDVLQDPPGTQIQIGTGAGHASRVVLPVIPNVSVPAGLPPCPSLRGQPCRPYTAL